MVYFAHFLFSFVFHDYFLFEGEDILDSAVYSRGENTNGYTNGDNVDGQRNDVSSPILPEYGAGNLGKILSINSFKTLLFTNVKRVKICSQF